MAKQTVERTIDVDPIDRLEEKIRMLVQLVTRLRGEQAKTADEHARLLQEIDALRARLGSAQEAQQELDALRGERDAIRGRVAEMLAQIESL